MLFSSLFAKKFLGIDIGTVAIKLVELAKRGSRVKLQNYAQIQAKSIYQAPFRTFEKKTLLLSSQDISRAVMAMLSEAKIKTRKCIFSIPDFSTFFTNFDLPSMTKEELPEAVRYEARQHIPLPLGEVTIGWQIISGQEVPEQKKTNLKILLAAVPNEVINQYREIAKLCGLELLSLEAEVFGIIKALVPDDNRKTLCLIDIGAQSTTCSIVDKKTLRTSHSFDLAGNEFTERIAKSLSLDYKAAEDLKNREGLAKAKEILSPLLDAVLREIDKTAQGHKASGGKEVEKFIVAGGEAQIPGLREYFQEHLKKETEIANPFANIFYPPILEKTIKEIGPAYSVAVGMALRGLE